MYERFTDRARKAMQLANQEAQRCNHDMILPLHILVGVVKEGNGVACNTVLSDEIQGQVLHAAREAMPKGAEGSDIIMGKLPLSVEAKAVVERSIEVAKEWRNNWVGTEHMLVSLCSDESCGNVLAAFDITAESSEKKIKVVSATWSIGKLVTLCAVCGNEKCSCHETAGLMKANDLLLKGMGAIIESRDELKHKCRTLEEDNAKLRELLKQYETT